jgi:hypothetical protein
MLYTINPLESTTTYVIFICFNGHRTKPSYDCYLLQASGLAYSSTLKMGATYSSKISVDIQMSIYLSMDLQPFVWPRPLFQFVDHLHIR